MDGPQSGGHVDSIGIVQHVVATNYNTTFNCQPMYMSLKQELMKNLIKEAKRIFPE
jgi:hypothetical protein